MKDHVGKVTAFRFDLKDAMQGKVKAFQQFLHKWCIWLLDNTLRNNTFVDVLTEIWRPETKETVWNPLASNSFSLQIKLTQFDDEIYFVKHTERCIDADVTVFWLVEYNSSPLKGLFPVDLTFNLLIICVQSQYKHTFCNALFIHALLHWY